MKAQRDTLLRAENKRRHLLNNKQSFLMVGFSEMPLELLHPLLGGFCFLPKERQNHVKITKRASILHLNLMLTLIVFILDYSICKCD